MHKTDVDQKQIVLMWVRGHVDIGGNEALGEMRLLTELLKRFSAKNMLTIFPLFRPKTFDCHMDGRNNGIKLF